LLIVVSAPSGAGKTSLCDCLLAERGDIVYSVSCTTRPSRGNEVHGKEYYFLSDEEFDRHAAAGEFLEHAVVHGHKYGTLKKTVRNALARGTSVLMDIDVQGAALIRNAVASAAENDPLRRGFVDVFIAPPSMQVLEERLRGRAEDPHEAIERRLETAREEMRRAGEYGCVITNDDLHRACRELTAVLRKKGGGNV